MAASIVRPTRPCLKLFCRSYSGGVLSPATLELSRSAAAPLWHLYSAVCLERKPVITAPLSPLEQQFSQLLAQIELERSLKSDHEMRHEKDLLVAEALKVSEADDVELIEEASMQTAADFEDACAEELAAFKPAPRTTEADRTNDQRSTDRLLDRSLVLVVKQKLGNGAKWMLPQGRHVPGETMRQTAERTLHTIVGPDIRARFLGNAPWGYYKYKYPKSLRNESGAIGGKVFFYKAIFDSGSVTPRQDEIVDYLWLGREELQKQLLSSYYRSVQRFLIDED